MQNSNLSPSSPLLTIKLQLKVKYFVISAVPPPDPGDLQSPSCCVVLLVGFPVFPMVGARRRLQGDALGRRGVSAVQEPCSAIREAGDAVCWAMVEHVRRAAPGWLLKSRVPVLGTEVNGNRCGAQAGRGGGGTRTVPAHAGAVGLTHAVQGARGCVTKCVPFRKPVC